MSELEHNSNKREGHDNSSFVGLAVSFVVFVAVPYELYILGVPWITDFAITIFLAGFLADIFTTKIGFRRGYDDYNMLFSSAKKKGKSTKSAFVSSIIIFGIIRGAIIVYFWNDPIVLMIVATTALIGPLWNSIILSSPEKRKSVDEDIKITNQNLKI
jgi:hypothetical protein